MMIFLKYCKNIANRCRFGAGILIMPKPKVRSILSRIHIEMLNEQNVLGSLMTAVTTCESNIQSIWTEELENNVLLVIIQVGARDIYHLENIMRKIKQITSVIRLKRNINEA